MALRKSIKTKVSVSNTRELTAFSTDILNHQGNSKPEIYEAALFEIRSAKENSVITEQESFVLKSLLLRDKPLHDAEIAVILSKFPSDVRDVLLYLSPSNPSAQSLER